MAATEEVDFRASDLIGSAGVGANGEKLVNTLAYHYPPALEAALLRRENPALTRDLSDSDRSSVAKIAGVEKIEDVKVRGGERTSDDAWVTYAYFDDRGTVVKGAFPYPDLGSSSSDDHISQRDSLNESPAARDHRSAQAKAAAASDSASSEDVDALRAQVEELTQRLDAEPEDPEPVDDYGKANARDIATMLTAAPRETVERVLAYEQSHEDRSTVKDAAQKRLAALDAEAKADEEARQALEQERDALVARVAELEAEAAKSGDGADAGE